MIQPRKYVPLEITRTVFSGEGPKEVTETRYLFFNNWAYRQAAEHLGIDLVAESKKAREALEAKGRTNGAKQKPPASEVAASMLDLEVDNIRMMSVYVWAGLLTEARSRGETLDLDTVESWFSMADLERVGTAVAEAMAAYLPQADTTEAGTPESDTTAGATADVTEGNA